MVKENNGIVCRIYLKNKDELEKYLIDLCKQNKHPTLSDVKFNFEWGTITV